MYVHSPSYMCICIVLNTTKKKKGFNDNSLTNVSSFYAVVCVVFLFFFSFAFLTSLPPSFGSFDILLLSLLFPTPLRDLHTYIHTIYIRTFEYTNKLKEHHTNSCIAVVIVVVLFFL